MNCHICNSPAETGCNHYDKKISGLFELKSMLAKGLDIWFMKQCRIAQVDFKKSTNTSVHVRFEGQLHHQMVGMYTIKIKA